jgi:hypothetical protein
MKTTLVLVVTMSLVATLGALDTSKPFSLTTLVGQKFKNCRITKATPEGITVVHDGGVARLSFAVLGDEWKQHFNYDPEKAREYAEVEEAKRKEVEAKVAEMKRKRAEAEEAQLAALAAAERRRLEAEAKALQDHQNSVAAANAPLTPLAPLPGDATPNLGTAPPQPIMYTEEVVPTVPPVGDPYSPGGRYRSRSYFYSDGYLPFGGYYPYQPIYGIPNCGHHITPCPPSSSIPIGSGAVISTGGISTSVGLHRH